MHKGFIQTAAALAGLAVVLGAFGSHGLKGMLTAAEQLTFETAVRYQFYHAFALLCIGILFRDFATNWLRWAGRFFIYGIIIFSGSLYLLTFFRVGGVEGFNWLGAITPLGGICFVIGWILMILAVARKS